jgi:hypothetical protein
LLSDRFSLSEKRIARHAGSALTPFRHRLDSTRAAEAPAAGGGRLARLAAIEQLRAAGTIPDPAKNRCRAADAGRAID